jgi:pyruvate-ferredoxin/flavodoxin oxidoreductase
MNFAAVDAALAALQRGNRSVPRGGPTSSPPCRRRDPAPEFVQKVTARLLAERGRPDARQRDAASTARWPTGTARFEKRNIALEIPAWDPAICIQCNKCVDRLPARRDPRQGLRAARSSPARRPAFKPSVPSRSTEYPGPALHAAGRARGLHRLRALRRRSARPKDKTEPAPQGHRHGGAAAAARAAERANWDFFLGLPGVRPPPSSDDACVKGTQFLTAAVRVLRRLLPAAARRRT